MRQVVQPEHDGHTDQRIDNPHHNKFQQLFVNDRGDLCQVKRPFPFVRRKTGILLLIIPLPPIESKYSSEFCTRQASLSEKSSSLHLFLPFCRLRLRPACGMIKFQKSDHLKKKKGCGFSYEKECCRTFRRVFFGT